MWNQTGWVPRLLFLAVVAWLDVAPAWAACGNQGTFHLTSPGPWQKSLVARPGGVCENTFRAGGAMVFKQLFLVAPPGHGKVTLRQGGWYRYAAQPGYSGRDTFTLRVCGVQAGHEGCANIVYNVTLQ
jgi:hypothetical protein